MLRQDNADIRLTEIGHAIGLASDERLQNVLEKKSGTAQLLNELKQKKITPAEINDTLVAMDTAKIKEKIKLEKIIETTSALIFPYYEKQMMT